MKQRSPLWLLGLSLFIWGIGEGMFMLFNPLYLGKLGADPLKIGGILGAFGLAMTVAHVPAGWLADRIGARPLLRWSWSTGLLATLIMAAAPGLSLFIVGLLLYGITAAVSAPLSAYVTASRGKWTVARALTTTSAAFNAGYIIGPKLGGLLADRLGLSMIYRFSAVLFIISTTLVWLLPDRRETPDGDEAVQQPVRLLANGRYLAFLALTFAVMLGMFLPQQLSPNYLQDVHNLRYSDVGTLGTIGGLGNVLLSLTLGAWPNWRLAYLASQAAMAGFALALWRGKNLPIFALGYFLLGGYRAARSLTTAKIRELVHVSQVALAYAISETVSGGAIILAPMLAGALYESAPTRMYQVGLGLLLVTMTATLLFYLTNRRSHAANRPSDTRTS